MEKDLSNSLKKILFLTTKKDRLFFIILLCMTIFLSVIEAIGISAIMPFITFASNPSSIFSNFYSSKIYEFFSFESTRNFMFFFGGVLIVFYCFRACYTVFYNYLINLFSFRKYFLFSRSLFEKILQLNYLNFTSKNTDYFRRNITTDAMHASLYFRGLLLLSSEVFTSLILYFVLMIINWKMTLVLSAILSVKVLLITKTISRYLAKVGEKKMQNDQKIFGILSSTFGNFKIIKIKGAQNTLEKFFQIEGEKRKKLESLSQTLVVLPKNILETVGFSVLIGCVCYILFRYEDASMVLPIISMYALALYRALPSVSRMLEYYNQMKLCSKSLSAVYEELSDVPQSEGDIKIEFSKEITMQDICFSYIHDKPIIQNFSLTIKKGEKIAFVGPSGAGKSTLVDIIAGFYHPDSGKIFVDSIPLTQENVKSWRKKIGYIPQQIYLFDGDVAENIAFGSEYDEEKIVQACKIAKIYDFLQEHEGIHTKVGDGGIKLSGGQKQRIGIARAIYDNPEILVLDEATSALDNDTEAQIMDEIYELSKDKTLLVIAHRLSTVERCDRTIEIGVREYGR